jgi:hypothetical protein
VPKGYPGILNPCFTAIVARRVRLNARGEILADPKNISELLGGREFPVELCPDLIIAGRDNLVIPLVESPEPPGFVLNSPCYLPREKRSVALPAEGVAFGIGLIQLMWALDWIQLGIVAWMDVFQDAFPKMAPR